MKKKILMLVQNAGCVRELTQALKRLRCELVHAADIPTGLCQAYAIHPDLILLAHAPPHLDAIDAIRQIRELSPVPILVLIEKKFEASLPEAMNLGANDYLIYPFDPALISERVKLFLSGHEVKSRASMICVGNLTIDLARRQVSVRRRVVPLSPMEYGLLVYLTQHRGQAIPGEALLANVWGEPYREQVDFLQFYIRQLRNKIERDPAHPQILRDANDNAYRIAD